MTPFTYDNLMTHERKIHDEVIACAAETGEDPKDVLLELCTDSYYGARIAEVIGGAEARTEFRARYIEQRLAEPENQRTDGKLVRDMSNGRIGVVQASHDGRYLIEFAGGTEVMNACDTQGVGPDPGVEARAEQLRKDAEHARLNAAHCPDPNAAAQWQEEADRAEQEAKRVDASSMDWLADPSCVYGFDGAPTTDPAQTAEPVDEQRIAVAAAHDDNGNDDADGM